MAYYLLNDAQTFIGQTVQPCVQFSNVIQSGNSLQAWGHVMQVRRHPISLKPRRICLCRVQDLISSSDVLQPLLNVPGHLADNAVVLVHGMARAAAQGLVYLLRELGHLEDGRKALDNGQGGGEFEVSRFLTTLSD